MKKLFITICILLIAACAGDKYDAALDNYEDIVLDLQTSLQKGDQKRADNAFKQLRDLSPMLNEVSAQGSEQQKQRMAELSRQMQDVLQQSINSTADELNDIAP